MASSSCEETVSLKCNVCGSENAIWRCPTCDDLDYCNQCKQTIVHPHLLEEITLLANVGSTHDQRLINIQRCLGSLAHACKCVNKDCRLIACMKMKRTVLHTKMCKRRKAGKCPVCKQLISLCCYHAKSCQDNECQVPYCDMIKVQQDDAKFTEGFHPGIEEDRESEGDVVEVDESVAEVFNNQ